MRPEPGRPPHATVATLAAALALLSGAVLGLPLMASESAPKLGPSPEVQATLDAVQSAYRRLPSVEADFVQTSSGISYPKPLVQEGVVALKAPAQMDWVFHTPSPWRYVSDGLTLWVVDEAEKVCTVYRQVGGPLRRMFGFLTGMDDLRSEYSVDRVTEGKEARSDRRVLCLKPHAQDGRAETVYVHIDPKTSLVRGVVVHSGYGDRTETQLLRIRTEAELPDSRFQWEAGAGYRVVEGG